MTTNPRDKPATLVPPPLVYFSGLAAGWAIDRYVPIRFDAGSGSHLFGLILIAGGLALTIWSAYTIWRHHTTVNPYKAVAHLVSSGPYAYTRNPIYLGDWLIYAGITLLLGTWWTLAFAPVVWWVMRYHVIAHEEAHLEAKFGEAFLEYKSTTRRWI